MKIQDFVCGLIAGWSQIIVGQPLDFIKVKIQTERELSKRSILQVAREIQNQYGWLGFYRGASSLFFGFAFTIGMEFTIYEFAKRSIFGLRNREDKEERKYNDGVLDILDVGMAGAIVGASVSLIYCPVQYVKIKRQLHNQVHTGSLSLLMNQIKNNRLQNISKGLTATILRQTFGSFIYYGVYEYIVRALSKFERHNANTLNYLVGGGMAGLSYWLVSYPFDVIKTKVQDGNSYNQAVKYLLSTSYRGFGAVFIRSILVNGSSFAAYENAKELLNYLKQERH